MTPDVAEKIADEALSELVRAYREPLLAVYRELEHQATKWGWDKPQSLPGFLLILESELQEAKMGWMKNLGGRNSPLSEVVQVAAVALACMARYGTTGNARATDDVTVAEMREERLQASVERWGAG